MINRTRRKALEAMRKFIVSENPWKNMKGNSSSRQIQVWNTWEILTKNHKFMEESDFSAEFEKFASIIGMDTINNVGPGFCDLI